MWSHRGSLVAAPWLLCAVAWPAYAEIESVSFRIRSARAGQQVPIAPGIHMLNNPVVVTAKGVRITGAGRRGKDATILHPKNPGRPMFQIDADDVGIADLTMDARVKGAAGRATFAVQIGQAQPGVQVDIGVRRDRHQRITSDLRVTLEGAGSTAIGIVRVPYFILAGRGPKGRDLLWHLTVEGQRIALVSRLAVPPEASLSFP